MKYTENTKDSKETIVIFSGNVARKLLKLGYTIVDIKPDKTNSLKSVFVFKVERNIEYYIAQFTVKSEDRRIAI